MARRILFLLRSPIHHVFNRVLQQRHFDGKKKEEDGWESCMEAVGLVIPLDKSE